MTILLINKFQKLFIHDVVTYSLVSEGIRISLPNAIFMATPFDASISLKIKEKGVKNTVLEFSNFDEYKVFYTEEEELKYQNSLIN
jgi:hypothetical protein